MKSTSIPPFEDFATLRDELEKRKLEIARAELIRIPTHTKKLTDAEVEDVLILIEKLEEDDDVASVFHTMDESE